MIVFDLDGTLALDEHRVHHLLRDPKEWKEYFSKCESDAINIPVRAVLFALHNATSEPIVIWTGRSAEVKDETIRWLKATGIYDCISELNMRPIGDHTDDTEMKRRWLNEAKVKGKLVSMVFEDRQRVVDMWRAEGLVCLQVAPGAF